MRTQSENLLLEARKKTNYQVAIVYSFAFDWLKGWREFFGPTTELSIQSQS